MQDCATKHPEFRPETSGIPMEKRRFEPENVRTNPCPNHDASTPDQPSTVDAPQSIMSTAASTAVQTAVSRCHTTPPRLLPPHYRLPDCCLQPHMSDESTCAVNWEGRPAAAKKCSGADLGPRRHAPGPRGNVPRPHTSTGSCMFRVSVHGKFGAAACAAQACEIYQPCLRFINSADGTPHACHATRAMSHGFLHASISFPNSRVPARISRVRARKNWCRCPAACGIDNLAVPPARVAEHQPNMACRPPRPKLVRLPKFNRIQSITALKLIMTSGTHWPN